VRGKRVDYQKRNSQRVLGLRDVETCDVAYRKQVYDSFRSRSEWDGLCNSPIFARFILLFIYVCYLPLCVFLVRNYRIRC
jgi:hypothetical protein